MKLKGSYTVEAAAIISLCMLILSVAICLSFDIYRECVEYVKYRPDKFDAVSLFRMKESLMGTFNAIKK